MVASDTLMGELVAGGTLTAFDFTLSADELLKAKFPPPRRAPNPPPRRVWQSSIRLAWREPRPGGRHRAVNRTTVVRRSGLCQIVPTPPHHILLDKRTGGDGI